MGLDPHPQAAAEIDDQDLIAALLTHHVLRGFPSVRRRDRSLESAAEAGRAKAVDDSLEVVLRSTLTLAGIGQLLPGTLAVLVELWGHGRLRREWHGAQGTSGAET